MDERDDSAAQLLRDRPDLRDPLATLLEIDREREWWTFDDVPLDSGEFGEIAAHGLLNKDGSKYRLSNPDAVERTLNAGDTSDMSTGTDRTSDERFTLDAILSLARRRWGGVALVGILCVAAFFRLAELGSAPFFGDELWQAWASRTFLLGEGFSNPVGASEPYTRSWLTTSLPIAASFWLFGFTEFAGRLPIALIGIAVIAVWYLFARELFDRRVAVVFAAFLAMEPYMITWSRMARDYAPLQLLFALGALLFLLWYREDGLDPRSVFLVGFGLVSVLGFQTHQSYLAIGAVIPAFLVVSLLVEWSKTKLYDHAIDRPFAYRRVAVAALCVAAGLAFVLLRGVPAQLLAAPEWYGGRPWDFYLTLVQSEYPILYVVAFVGIVYNSLRGSDGRYLVVLLVLPFAVHTYSPWREARYIAHLYPLVVLVFVSTATVGADAFVRWINDWEDPDFELSRYSISRSTLAVVLVAVLLLTVSVSPWSAWLYVTTNSHGYVEDRSDHRTPVEDLGGYIEADHAVISSTPQMTMWYLDRDRVDYMLSAQRPERRSQPRNGELIDPRTGTIVLNENVTKLRETTERHETGWLFADTRYRFYVSKEMKRAVDAEMTRISSDRWANIDLYYWGPEETLDSIDDDPTIRVHR